MNAENQAPIASTRSELRNLRSNSQATVAELKAFLGELKGRAPREMLGMVAGNELFRASIHAMLLITSALVIFTVIPYLNRKDPVAASAADEPAPHAPASEALPTDAPLEPKVPSDANPPDALGIGMEKQSPGTVNPLDTGTGNFLDDLE